MAADALDLDGWLAEMNRLAEEFAADFEAVHGFPPDEHTIRESSAEDGAASAGMLARAGVPGSLVTLYSVLGAAELPDFENGVWIDDASSLLEQAGAATTPSGWSGRSRTV